MSDDTADATRRALALLTGSLADVPEMEDEAFVWEMLGADDEQQINTVRALIALFLGTVENYEDPNDVLMYLGSRVQFLEE